MFCCFITKSTFACLINSLGLIVSLNINLKFSNIDDTLFTLLFWVYHPCPSLTYNHPSSSLVEVFHPHIYTLTWEHEDRITDCLTEVSPGRLTL